jgi:dipeptidyl aminopeptidase/acylaminoacyl peptidase
MTRAPRPGRRDRAPRAAGLVCAGLVAAVGAGCAQGQGEREGRLAARREAARREIAAALTAQNPNPVSVSPDGARLLLKSLHERDFELHVIDRASGRAIASQRQPDTQLAPTWRPDGRMIAFLADRGGDQQYRVHLLDPATGAARLLDAPATTATALRWSPSGSLLAYLVARRGARARQLVVIDPTGGRPPAVVADGVSDRAGFTWSPDGRRLATVLLADTGSVVLVDAGGGGRQSRPAAAGGEIRQLAWSPDGGSLLVTARAAGGEHFDLVEIRSGGGAPAVLASPGGDVSGPLYLPRGDGVAYHLNTDGETGVFALRRGAGAARRLGPPGGNAVITGFTPDGAAAWVLGTDRRSPPILRQVPLDGGAPVTLHAATARGGAAAEAERIDLVAADGVRVPAYLWRPAPAARRTPGMIVRIHGGPDAQSFRAWDAMIQLAVGAGVHVLSVNYRGSTGYGRAFEEARGGHLARVPDILAAVDHAVRRLGIPRGRVVLFGHSYGALLAADAATAAVGPLGGAVLVSLAGRPAHRPLPAGAPLLAFHGDRDAAAAPDQARARIAGSLGAAPRMTVFHDEGHMFHRIESWAEVWAATLALLEEPE